MARAGDSDTGDRRIDTHSEQSFLLNKKFELLKTKISPKWNPYSKMLCQRAKRGPYGLVEGNLLGVKFS